MPNSTSNTPPKIFELIQSLNTSEVTYFRRHAKQNANKEPTYLTVFNKMLKMDTYNEDKLATRVG